MARNQIASDDFNRASIGANWTQLVPSGTGSVTIQSSTVITSSAGGADSANPSARWDGSGTFANNQYSKLKLTAIADIGDGTYWIGVIARASADTEGTRDFYYFAWRANSTTVLGKVVNGTNTQLGTDNTISWANGDTIELEVDGTELRCYRNGSIIAALTTTDSALTTGKPGVMASQTLTGDDWEGGDVTSATLEQSHFRWGLDDNNEASHGWAAAEDTNLTLAVSNTRLLRSQVNVTGDQGATAYALRYQKNGSGGYVALPVGSTTKITPVIESGDATESGNNTASTSWAVSHPAASPGDLLIFCISWDDSTTVTDVTEPAGPNSEVLSEVNATPATDSGTNVRCKVWYTVATGSWSASTRTFTPSASEQWTAAVIKVPAGEFDSATPIGAFATHSGASTSVQHAGSWSAGSTDGSGKLCVWAAVDVNPMTVASGFSEVANEDRGALAGGFFTRNSAVSDSESFSATTAATITSEDWATVAFVVRAPTVNNEVYIDTSSNIAASGEATTARLSAPSGKTTSDFTTGRRWDDENGTDTIDITADDYTEVEWPVRIVSPAANNDFYDFRVYAGASAFTTYTITPRWTIGSGATVAPLAVNHLSSLMGS